MRCAVLIKLIKASLAKQIFFGQFSTGTRSKWTPSPAIQRQSQKESQKLQAGPWHMAGIGEGQICLENHLSQGCPHI